jgi:hypothetical protein
VIDLSTNDGRHRVIEDALYAKETAINDIRHRIKVTCCLPPRVPPMEFIQARC